MDEMQLLRDFAGPAGLPAAGDLARKRAELITAATARRPARRRWVWGSAAAAGLAAAVTAVVALSPGATIVPPGPAPRPVTDPVSILYTAAAKARALPDVEPRPDQFLYTRTRLADGRENEFWASADGTHDGFQVLFGHESDIAGCRNGRRVQQEGRGRTVTHRCTPHPAAHPELPTDADAMLAYLHKSTYGEGDTLHDLGNEVVALAGGYLRPAARAALYEAVAKVPGLVARADAQGAAGRPVLGITWNSTTEHAISNQDEFLFDPATFAYLGSGTTGVVVRQGIVGSVRQRP
ncbi:CU044_5270 family protein [Amycolatopsis sp. A133]|uniref:CU044_5270 family protein n=1 Tax=Amycolatopsis sp. A133 TaxID=3064472 RepID=UPI0027FBD12C|nr:CU044_5270 family protein [Amycolatopsis sp. A133]MDQ7802260.1 CU044_5270 family protein [Amycolatopsis sp. A133]